jgi:hypothetical protein
MPRRVLPAQSRVSERCLAQVDGGRGKLSLMMLQQIELGVPFVELDRLIEVQSGLTLDLVFDFHGQAGFRRLELQCLEAVLRQHDPFEEIRLTPAASAEFSGPKSSR